MKKTEAFEDTKQNLYESLFQNCCSNLKKKKKKIKMTMANKFPVVFMKYFGLL